MIRVVADTNVVVSAALTQSGPSSLVVELADDGLIQLAFPRPCLPSTRKSSAIGARGVWHYLYPRGYSHLPLTLLLATAPQGGKPGQPDWRRFRFWEIRVFAGEVGLIIGAHLTELA